MLLLTYHSMLANAASSSRYFLSAPATAMPLKKLTMDRKTIGPATNERARTGVRVVWLNYAYSWLSCEHSYIAFSFDGRHMNTTKT